MGILRESILDGGKSKCNCPKVGVFLVEYHMRWSQRGGEVGNGTSDCRHKIMSITY